jgi:hypothetical protein
MEQKNSDAASNIVQNLTSLWIWGIDAIENLGVTYLSKTKSFRFQEDLSLENFQKADLSD